MNDIKLEHALMVARNCKSGEDIIKELTPKQAEMWHMATGIAGEAGELLDAIKKYVIYQRPLDRQNAIEELGDGEFYMEAMRRLIGVSRDEVLQANLDKLNKRYNKGYSNQAAIERADKQ